MQTHPLWGKVRNQWPKGTETKWEGNPFANPRVSAKWEGNCRNSLWCQRHQSFIGTCPPLISWAGHSSGASASHPWLSGPRPTPALWLVPRIPHSPLSLPLQIRAPYLQVSLCPTPTAAPAGLLKTPLEHTVYKGKAPKQVYSFNTGRHCCFT